MGRLRVADLYLVAGLGLYIFRYADAIQDDALSQIYLFILSDPQCERIGGLGTDGQDTRFVTAKSCQFQLCDFPREVCTANADYDDEACTLLPSECLKKVEEMFNMELTTPGPPTTPTPRPRPSTPRPRPSPGITPAPPKPPTPFPMEARDWHRDCCYWAQKGECETNKRFMCPVCQLSCGSFRCSRETYQTFPIAPDRNCVIPNEANVGGAGGYESTGYSGYTIPPVPAETVEQYSAYPKQSYYVPASTLPLRPAFKLQTHRRRRPIGRGAWQLSSTVPVYAVGAWNGAPVGTQTGFNPNTGWGPPTRYFDGGYRSALDTGNRARALPPLPEPSPFSHIWRSHPQHTAYGAQSGQNGYPQPEQPTPLLPAASQFPPPAEYNQTPPLLPPASQYAPADNIHPPVFATPPPDDSLVTWEEQRHQRQPELPSDFLNFGLAKQNGLVRQGLKPDHEHSDWLARELHNTVLGLQKPRVPFRIALRFPQSEPPQAQPRLNSLPPALFLGKRGRKKSLSPPVHLPTNLPSPSAQRRGRGWEVEESSERSLAAFKAAADFLGAYELRIREAANRETPRGPLFSIRNLQPHSPSTTTQRPVRRVNKYGHRSLFADSMEPEKMFGEFVANHDSRPETQERTLRDPA